MSGVELDVCGLSNPRQASGEILNDGIASRPPFFEDRDPLMVQLSCEDERFRDEVRQFLSERFPADLRRAARRQAGIYGDPAVTKAWHHILYEKGWVAPNWPREYGGPGWTPAQRLIFEAECVSAGTPTLPAMGLQMCGPALIGYGSDEQKRFYLPRILSGEHQWCQGYSEPQAGSDLAKLQCRADRQGDDYVINGSKIWTTHAHWASHIFLLVRTSRKGRAQAGITFLLAPIDLPGITIRPIIGLSGEHEVNQVFFDNVRVPVANRVGEENGGWDVAKYLLEFERGGGFAPGRALRLMAVAKNAARAEAGPGGTKIWEQPWFRRRFAQLEIEVRCLERTQWRVLTQLSVGESVGAAYASLFKIKASETFQAATELVLDVLGTIGQIDYSHWLTAGEETDQPFYEITAAAYYLNSRAATIFGGAAEIQRDILAQMLLGPSQSISKEWRPE